MDRPTTALAGRGPARHQPHVNPAVCEGCGDCGVKSNCVAVVPFETEFGRKRAIDQSACNKDFSCVDGAITRQILPELRDRARRQPAQGYRRFARRRGAARSARAETAGSRSAVRDHRHRGRGLPGLDRPYEIIVTGVGSTGVITIGALLGMAAHLESKGCSVLDQTGLAQKGGAVVSHVRIAARPDDITTTRIANGAAHLVLGCDVVVTAGAATRAAMRTGRTAVVVNTQETMTGDFTRDADLVFPADALMRGIERVAGARQVDRVDATRIATALVGDAIATNMFMLGYAWQKGRIPLSRGAIRRAIEINAVAVESNLSAFDWGRRTAADRDSVGRRAAPSVTVAPPHGREGLQSVVERRSTFLVDYQDEAYARRYRDLVERVQAAERSRAKGMRGLAESAARGYFKVLAYKDEYEVARLHASPEFRRRLEATFEGDFTLEFHLAPPLLARRDPTTGEPRKRRYGAWMMRLFAVLAKLRGLRGTPLDPFGYTAERRRERRLIERYERAVSSCIDGLDHTSHAIAVEIASLPDGIRGFGHVKVRSIEEAERREAELLARFGAAVDPPDAA